ncbi:MAG: glycosyltransferase family 2 protein [Patescibacteria group bacterium]
MILSPFVSIIIVQYNNSDDTIGCLESLKNLNYPNFRVVLIDNASEIKHFNNVRLYVESLKDIRFSFIVSKKNLGYSGGNNLGIKKALKNKADYIFILNPDTTVKSTVLTKLIEVAEANSKIGIVGPTINENASRIVYGGKINWLKPELAHSEIPPLNTDRLLLDTNLYILGAAMLIKKNVINKIGLLDERYFLYFEDADYCMRARKVGCQLAIATNTSIDHSVSKSTNQLGSAKLLYYHYRNAHLFNWENGPFYIKLALPFWSFFIIIKQLAKILLDRESVISKAILAGIIDFYKKNFGKIS